jgi:hypothetical protein
MSTQVGFLRKEMGPWLERGPKASAHRLEPQRRGGEGERTSAGRQHGEAHSIAHRVEQQQRGPKATAGQLERRQRDFLVMASLKRRGCASCWHLRDAWLA